MYPEQDIYPETLNCIYFVWMFGLFPMSQNLDFATLTILPSLI